MTYIEQQDYRCCLAADANCRSGAAKKFKIYIKTIKQTNRLQKSKFRSEKRSDRLIGEIRLMRLGERTRSTRTLFGLTLEPLGTQVTFGAWSASPPDQYRNDKSICSPGDRKLLEIGVAYALQEVRFANTENGSPESW